MQRRIDEARRQVKSLELPGDDSDAKDDKDDEESEKASSKAADDSSSVKIRVAIPPAYFYIKHVSDAERGEAAKAAFAEARGQAERLAAAAGMKLAGLTSLNENGIPGQIDISNQQAMATEMMADMFSGGPAKFGDENNLPKNELMSGEFKKIRCETMVSAAFAITP